MTLPIVQGYLELALLVAMGWALAAGLLRLSERLGGRQPARSWLRLGRLLLVTVLVLPPLAGAMVRPDRLFQAPVQVAALDSRRSPGLSFVRPTPASHPGTESLAPVLIESALAGLALAFVAASGFGALRLVQQWRRLRRTCRSATPIREIGRVRISVSDAISIPFSAWTGGRAEIVLPERFVLQPRHLRLALAHELFHLRGRDVAWVYVTALMRAALPWHPATGLWARWLSRLEELACDERVASRPRSSAGQYGECLVWAAEGAAHGSDSLALGVPMLNGSKSFLERRLTMLFDPPVAKRRSWIALAGAGAVVWLAVTAVVARGAVSDRRLSAAQVQAMADDLARASALHITADETVVSEVNAIVGDANARARFKEGLVRLEAYRAIGGEVLRKRGVPIELLAIAQQESRVQPLPERMNRMRSAGIWQFIPATARRYGLRIDETVDERLDPVRSAEAAAEYLADLHDEFQDWRMVVIAYNAGEDAVRRAAADKGTKDAVVLAKSGAVSRYASSVLAAALLIHDPKALD